MFVCIEQHISVIRVVDLYLYLKCYVTGVINRSKFKGNSINAVLLKIFYIEYT